MGRSRGPMMTEPDQAQEKAIAWATRIQDPAFDQWDDHCAWLEVPGNLERYHDAVLTMERGLAALRTAHSERQMARNDNGAPYMAGRSGPVRGVLA
jgi:ferric-dicitrate binding protein FerR (iron transport regulator)